MNKLILIMSLIFVLNACGSLTKEKLGIANKAPDETLVTTRPLLSLPPEYNLRPVVEHVDLEKISSSDEAW